MIKKIKNIVPKVQAATDMTPINWVRRRLPPPPKNSPFAPSNPANAAYGNTAADYGTPGTVGGGNILADVPCDSSVFVGAVVRMDGSTAINAVADSSTNSKAIGICVSKSSSTLCNIQICGVTDTVMSGLTVNENYFLSATTPGGLDTSPPTGSSHIVILIGRPYTTTRLVLQIGSQTRRAV